MAPPASAAAALQQKKTDCQAANSNAARKREPFGNGKTPRQKMKIICIVRFEVLKFTVLSFLHIYNSGLITEKPLSRPSISHLVPGIDNIFAYFPSPGILSSALDELKNSSFFFVHSTFPSYSQTIVFWENALKTEIKDWMCTQCIANLTLTSNSGIDSFFLRTGMLFGEYGQQKWVNQLEYIFVRGWNKNENDWYDQR